MIQVKKRTFKQLIFWLIAIYSVIPLYAQILGISLRNIWALIIFVNALILNGKENKGFKVHFNILYFCIGLWFILTSISLYLNSTASEIIFVFLRTFCLYFAVFKVLSNQNDLIELLKKIISVAGVLSIFGIIEEITHFNIFSLLGNESDLNYNPARFGILRILSFSSHTIVYGAYLMVILAFIVYIQQFVKKTERTRLSIIYFLCWINLLLTLSRSVILCTLISQFVLLLFQGKKLFLRKALKIVILFLILVGLLSLISPKIFSMVKNIYYMLLAVFDDSYSQKIAGSFGSDNLSAEGTRLKLYRWVFSSMKSSWTWGYGVNTNFHYPYVVSNGLYTWIQYKNSIEVEYLSILYHNGILVLFATIGVFISIIYICIKCGFKRSYDSRKLKFNVVLLSIFIPYYLLYFGVNQSSDQGIFYLCIMLLLVYYVKLRKMKIVVSDQTKGYSL